MSFLIRSFDRFSVQSLPDVLFGKLKFLYSNVDKPDFIQHQISYPSCLDTAVSKRKAEYLAGRLCAKKLLKCLKISTSSTQLPPREDRLPDWPEGLLGSISHTHACAVVGVAQRAQYGNLGLDVEFIMENDVAKSIVSQIATPQELSLLTEHLSFSVQVTLIFSIKESIYKALYPEVNRFFDFDAVIVRNINLQKSTFDAIITNNLNEKYTQGFVLSGYFILDFDDRKVFSVIVR